jgi:hypothetical protein
VKLKEPPTINNPNDFFDNLQRMKINQPNPPAAVPINVLCVSGGSSLDNPLLMGIN